MKMKLFNFVVRFFVFCSCFVIGFNLYMCYILFYDEILMVLSYISSFVISFLNLYFYSLEEDISSFLGKLFFSNEFSLILFSFLVTVINFKKCFSRVLFYYVSKLMNLFFFYLYAFNSVIFISYYYFLKVWFYVRKDFMLTYMFLRYSISFFIISFFLIYPCYYFKWEILSSLIFFKIISLILNFLISLSSIFNTMGFEHFSIIFSFYIRIFFNFIFNLIINFYFMNVSFINFTEDKTLKTLFFYGNRNLSSKKDEDSEKGNSNSSDEYSKHFEEMVSFGTRVGKVSKEELDVLIKEFEFKLYSYKWNFLDLKYFKSILSSLKRKRTIMDKDDYDYSNRSLPKSFFLVCNIDRETLDSFQKASIIVNFKLDEILNSKKWKILEEEVRENKVNYFNNGRSFFFLLDKIIKVFKLDRNLRSDRIVLELLFIKLYGLANDRKFKGLEVDLVSFLNVSSFYPRSQFSFWKSRNDKKSNYKCECKLYSEILKLLDSIFGKERFYFFSIRFFLRKIIYIIFRITPLVSFYSKSKNRRIHLSSPFYYGFKERGTSWYSLVILWVINLSLLFIRDYLKSEYSNLKKEKWAYNSISFFIYFTFKKNFIYAIKILLPCLCYEDDRINLRKLSKFEKKFIFTSNSSKKRESPLSLFDSFESVYNRHRHDLNRLEEGKKSKYPSFLFSLTKHKEETKGYRREIFTRLKESSEVDFFLGKNFYFFRDFPFQHYFEAVRLGEMGKKPYNSFFFRFRNFHRSSLFFTYFPYLFLEERKRHYVRSKKNYFSDNGEFLNVPFLSKDIKDKFKV